MRIKVIYRKNLKMSVGKIAAQTTHAVIGLGITDPLCTIIVLGVSDKKFKELTNEYDCYIHQDFGYTEVKENESTCAAWIDGHGNK
jgi:peptidyl-tRNA hydrolase